MTVGEKSRWVSAVKHAGEIVDRLPTDENSPFSRVLKDMKALQDELFALPDKPDPGAQKLGEQLGSAVSGLIGKNATVNVYVTVNGK